MPSSFSARARFTLQAPGENNNTWGTILNNGVFQLIEDAMMGSVAVAVSGSADLTVSGSSGSQNGATDRARMYCLACTGTGGTVTVPGVQKAYLIDASAATGAIVVTTGSGASAMVEAGNRAFVICPNGTDYYLVRDKGLQAILQANIDAANTARVSGDASTLASAKAYTDAASVGGATLPGSSTPTAVVYSPVGGGAAIWKILTLSDLTDGLTPADLSLTAYSEKEAALATSGTITLDFTAETVFTCALTGAATFALAAADTVTNRVRSAVLFITAGSNAVTWPGGWKWAGGAAPTLSTTATDAIYINDVSGTIYASTTRAFA